MIKSEFDPYSNLTFVYLDKARFCLDNGRYVKQTTLSDCIDRVENLADKADEIATDCIHTGSIETLSKCNDESNRLDFLSAKIELGFIPYKDN